jgi:UDP-N-acetylmuramate dehydrogenase
MDDILYNYLTHICGTGNIEKDALLSKHTTFNIGGPAKYIVTVKTREQLQKLISALNFLEHPYFILGLGANVLADSTGYNGVVIKLGFKEITHTDNFIYADAGAKLGVVCNYARDNGKTGMEWAVGIPATIGGSVYMNCGAFGKSMQDIVVMVDVLEDGEFRTITATEADFGYRHSLFQNSGMIIVGAYLRLFSGEKTEITQKMKEILVKRSGHPKEPSAGSVFKRPRDGFYVGETIEKLGMKGMKIGGAKVSEKHCGFIVNDGDATSDDVKAVINKVVTAVEESTGTRLETEIIMLGGQNVTKV